MYKSLQTLSSPTRGALGEHIRRTLDEAKQVGTFKSERVIRSPQSSTVALNSGSVLLNFCANNYWGLSNHPRLVAAAKKTLDTHGFGLSSVRFICGTQDIHKTLESRISAFHGMEDAILYGSCFDANAGIFEALLGEKDAIFSDELNHASIIDGVRLCKAKTKHRYKHLDYADLDAKLQETVAAGEASQIRLVVTDGVFSMDGDIAPLREIVELKDKYGAVLMLDEAHAVGVLGRGGRGFSEKLGLSHRIEVRMGTLGKALGSSGGYITGSRLLIDYLLNTARSFIFSTAPPASTAAAASAALDLCAGPEGDERREKLRRLAAIFDPAPPAAIYPLIIGSEDDTLRAAEQLAKLGFHVPPIRPPTVPKGTSRLRVSLSAAHEAANARTLAAALRGMTAPSTPATDNPDTVCPVCGAALISEKCKVVCRSAKCGYRIVFDCSEF